MSSGARHGEIRSSHRTVPSKERWCRSVTSRNRWRRNERQAAEARYRLVAEHASDVVCVVDADGDIAWVSPSVEGVLGWDPDELVGSPVATLLAPRGPGHGGPLAPDGARRGPVPSRWKCGSGPRPARHCGCHCGPTPWSTTPATSRRRSAAPPLCQSEVVERRAAATLLGGQRAAGRGDRRRGTPGAMCETAVRHGGYLFAWYGHKGDAPGCRWNRSPEATRTGLPGRSGADLGRRSAGSSRWAGPAVRRDRDRAGPSGADASWAGRDVAHGFGSSMSLPVRVNGAVEGVFTVYAAEPRAFGPRVVVSWRISSVPGIRHRAPARPPGPGGGVHELDRSVASWSNPAIPTRRAPGPGGRAVGRHRPRARPQRPPDRGPDVRRHHPRRRQGRRAHRPAVAAGSARRGGDGADPPPPAHRMGDHQQFEWPWPVAEVILQHHERMDGTGYPQGLRGDEILLEARIVAVADVFEAVSSRRPYRAALGEGKARGRRGRRVGDAVRRRRGGRVRAGPRRRVHVQCDEGGGPEPPASLRRVPRDPTSGRTIGAGCRPGEPVPTGRRGAGDGNRTRVSSLGSWRSTIELHPRRGEHTIVCRAWFSPTALYARRSPPATSRSTLSTSRASSPRRSTCTWTGTSASSATTPAGSSTSARTRRT